VSYEYGNEHAVSTECEGLPGWLINYLILQHDYAMKIQSNRLITIHYERHATGNGKSETHTDSLVGTNDEEDFDVHKNVP